MNVMGVTLSFYVIFIKIPNDNEESFNSEFKNNCDLFLKTINEIIDKSEIEYRAKKVP